MVRTSDSYGSRVQYRCMGTTRFICACLNSRPVEDNVTSVGEDSKKRRASEPSLPSPVFTRRSAARRQVSNFLIWCTQHETTIEFWGYIEIIESYESDTLRPPFSLKWKENKNYTKKKWGHCFRKEGPAREQICMMDVSSQTQPLSSLFFNSCKLQVIAPTTKMKSWERVQYLYILNPSIMILT